MHDHKYSGTYESNDDARTESDLPEFAKLHPKLISLQFHKTRMCIRGETCPKREKCTYAHYPEELRKNQTLSKTKICKDFQQGKCKLQKEDCTFAHGLKELVSTFSFFKTKVCNEKNVGCSKGAYCRNYHSPKEQLMAAQLINQLAQTNKSGILRHHDFVMYWKKVDPKSLKEFRIRNGDELASPKNKKLENRSSVKPSASPDHAPPMRQPPKFKAMAPLIESKGTYEIPPNNFAMPASNVQVFGQYSPHVIYDGHNPTYHSLVPPKIPEAPRYSGVNSLTPDLYVTPSGTYLSPRLKDPTNSLDAFVDSTGATHISRASPRLLAPTTSIDTTEIQDFLIRAPPPPADAEEQVYYSLQSHAHKANLFFDTATKDGEMWI